MSILANPKHEAFAQALAKGRTADEAYAEAGYRPNRGNAATLKAKQSISDRVTELLSKAAERTERTLEDMVAQLDADRAFARTHENPSAAIQASVAVAKLLGFMVERKQVDVHHTYEQMSDDELEREIAALEAELGGTTLQ